MIKTYDELLDTRIHPFPTRPCRVYRTVRFEHWVAAIDLDGRIYANFVGGRPTCIKFFGPNTRATALIVLSRLGVVAAAVDKEFERLAEKQHRQSNAADFLRYAEDLAALGVPLIPEQIRALKKIAKDG